jgi:hypothetical protein
VSEYGSAVTAASHSRAEHLREALHDDDEAMSSATEAFEAAFSEEPNPAGKDLAEHGRVLPDASQTPERDGDDARAQSS